MAALPVSLLILGVGISPLRIGPCWIKVLGAGDSILAPMDSFLWDSAASRLLSPLVESGYAFATLSVAGSELQGDTLLIETVVNRGPLVTVAEIAFSGKRRTNPRLLAHLAGFKPFVYSKQRVEKLIISLKEADCQVIDWELLLAPAENSGLLPDGRTPSVPEARSDSTARVLLNFLVEEKRRPNRLDAAVGYADEEGLICSVDLSLRDLFGGRRELVLSWRQLERYNLSFGLKARESYFLLLPFGIETQAAFRSLSESAYHLEALAGVFLRTQIFEAGLGYAYEQDRSQSLRVTKNLGTTRLATDFLEVNLRAGERRSDKSYAYLKSWAEGKVLIPLFWHFSFSSRSAAAVVASEDSLFVSELIPVGGARSLRGYVEEEFRTELAFWSRQELRWGSQAFSLYPLFDGAWIKGFGFAAGYGAGIALATPIGRLELDAALPWRGAWNQAKLHLSLTAEF